VPSPPLPTAYGLRVRIEELPPDGAPVYGRSLAVARVIESRGHQITGDRVLVRGADVLLDEMEIGSGNWLPVPGEIEPGVALLLPATARALWAWQSLGLEFGEAAVVTDGHATVDLLGQIALWQGALPIVRLGASPASDPPFEALSTSDAEAAARRLRSLAAERPGFAAIDLSGQPRLIGLLLDALPRWGRLLLAGRCRERLTLDVYGDVHRKGATVRSAILDPMDVFDAGPADPAWRRACRLLGQPKRAGAIRRLLPQRGGYS
jgi:hypothetical protein